MKRTALIMLFLGTCTSALAKDNTISSATRASISAVVEKYAASISCPENEPPFLRDVRVLSPRKSDLEPPVYLSVWIGSTACEGTGTTVFQFSVVEQHINGEFKVDPSRSTPVVDFDFPDRHFGRIVSITEKVLVVEANDYAKGDPNCCPSLRFQYKLKADKSGNWRLVSRKPINS